MFRLELAVGVFVAEAAVGHTVGAARLVIELRIFADLRAVVVSLGVHAPLVILRFVGVVDRHDLYSLAAGAVLVNGREAAVDDELYLQKKQ